MNFERGQDSMTPSSSAPVKELFSENLTSAYCGSVPFYRSGSIFLKVRSDKGARNTRSSALENIIKYY